LFLIYINLTACISIAGGDIPEIDSSALYFDNLEPKPSLAYHFDGLGYFEEHENVLLKELDESGYFSSIIKNPDKYYGIAPEKATRADIELNITLNNYSNMNLLFAVLSGFSLFTIPTWSTSDYQFEVQVVDRNALKSEFILMDSSTVITWLPLILTFELAIPHAPGNAADKIVWQNGFRNILLAIKDKGFLD